MGLLDFFKKNKKENVENRIDDSSKQNHHKEYTKEDIMKIDDDQELLEIVTNGHCGTSNIECAVSRMKNQRLLSHLLNCLTSFTDRQKKETIILGLTDQDFLCDLFIDENDYDLAKKINARINDSKAIKKTLLNSNKKIKRYGDLLAKLGEEDLIDILNQSNDEEVIGSIIDRIKNDKVKSEYLLNHQNVDSRLVHYIKDYEELHRIYQNTENEEMKNEVYKEIGIFICKKCGKENVPMTRDENNCQCKYCGEDNHEWEHVDHVTDYRDYSAGARYDICKRCKQRKNEQIINTL